MSNFPPTRWSLISAIRLSDETAAGNAIEELCRIYHPAVLAFAKLSLRNDQDAEDLTQDFFADLLSRGRMAQADSRAGKFRTFLLADFKFKLLDHLKRERAAKRGGNDEHVSIDNLTGEETTITLPDAAAFDVQWALAVVRESVRLLEQEEASKSGGIPFGELKRFLPGYQATGSPSYEDLEKRFGVSTGALRVRVNRMRQRYKELLNSVLADTVSSAADLESERQALLGGLIRSLG